MARILNQVQDDIGAVFSKWHKQQKAPAKRRGFLLFTI
jgi:hypothetical protein